MIKNAEARERSRKIEEYRRRLEDKDYLSNAILRIAHVLSEGLLDPPRYGDGHGRIRRQINRN